MFPILCLHRLMTIELSTLNYNHYFLGKGFSQTPQAKLNETTATSFLLARLVGLFFAVLELQGLGQATTSEIIK